MKDLKAQIERDLAAKLKAFGKTDDAKDRKMMSDHESSMHGVKHRAAGGAIEGGIARPRMDRAGGGKKSGKKGNKGTTVNVVIASKGGEDKPAMPPVGMPPPGAMAAPKPPMMPPPGPPAGGPPMPPPGAGPGGPPPMMRASGGRVPDSERQQMSDAGAAAGRKMSGRGELSTVLKGAEYGGMEKTAQRASGGRLGMTAGAGSGEGRLEKEDLQKRKG